VEEKRIDCQRLLTVLVNLLGVSFATAKRHPVALALKNDGIVHFHDGFIHMPPANIDSLQCVKGGALVPLKMNFKMML